MILMGLAFGPALFTKHKLEKGNDMSAEAKEVNASEKARTTLRDLVAERDLKDPVKKGSARHFCDTLEEIEMLRLMRKGDLKRKYDQFMALAGAIERLHEKAPASIEAALQVLIEILQGTPEQPFGSDDPGRNLPLELCKGVQQITEKQAEKAQEAVSSRAEAEPKAIASAVVAEEETRKILQNLFRA